MKQLTDFRQSYITWLTPENSYGRFSVEAVLEWQNQTYYLTSGVMACHMYQQQELIISPAYMYQAAFSNEHYQIFRSPSATGIATDSEGLISERFTNVHITARLSPVSEIKTTEIKTHLLNGTCLVAQVTLENKHTAATMTFPVKHINFSDAHKSFQAETGPVIAPSMNTKDTGNIMQLAYVAFNTLHTIDMVNRTPAHNSAGSYHEHGSYPASIHIYSYNT